MKDPELIPKIFSEIFLIIIQAQRICVLPEGWALYAIRAKTLRPGIMARR